MAQVVEQSVQPSACISEGPSFQFLFISGYAAMTVRKSLRRRGN